MERLPFIGSHGLKSQCSGTHEQDLALLMSQTSDYMKLGLGKALFRHWLVVYLCGVDPVRAKSIE